MNPGGSPIRSDNVYFANNEKVSLVFFIGHAEHNLIKLKLYNNWSLQAVNKISECDMWYLSESILPLKASQSIKSYKVHVIEIKARNSLLVRCREKRVDWKNKTKQKNKKNTGDVENLFFKAFANRFWLTF